MTDKVTQEQVDALIVGADYHVFPGTTVTICGLKLRNGFVVVGTSAAASPASFDYDVGERLAYQNARQKIWELEGYLLRSKLAGDVT
jgi:hypothetical protein